MTSTELIIGIVVLAVWAVWLAALIRWVWNRRKVRKL